MIRIHHLHLLIFLVLTFPAMGQLLTRSGQSWTSDNAAPLNVGCGGTTLLWTDFESGLPSGWNIIDGDTLNPMASTGLVRGWQIRQDYRDTSNHVLVNSSFTSPQGKSNDWFISPLISLGPNGCLSWKVYSQDNYYLESYEIWVANASDTTSLKAGTKVYSITNASASIKHLSVDLSAFSGQTISIAFHHTSYDKFVLALDDIRLTSRFEPDAWAYQLDTTTVLAFQTVFPELVVVNAGTDTLSSFQVHYQVNGGPTYSCSRSGLVLGSGDSIRVIHDSVWIPSGIGIFNLCMWVSNPNGLADAYVINDTLCHSFNVTSFIGLENFREDALHLYPTIVTGHTIHISGIHDGIWKLYDLYGKSLCGGIIDTTIRLPDQLGSGMYLVQVEDESGWIRTGRIIIP